MLVKYIISLLESALTFLGHQGVIQQTTISAH